MKNPKLKSTNSVVFVILGVAFIGLMIFAVTFYQSNSKNIEKYDAQVKMTEEVKVENSKLKEETMSQGESLKSLEQKVNELDKGYKKEMEDNNILRDKVDNLGKENEKYKSQVEDLDKKLKDKQARAKKAKDEQDKINSLEGKVASASGGVKGKDEPVTVSRGGGHKAAFRASFYTANCPTGCTGQSASGIWVNKSTHYQGRRVVAMPKRIPLHTKIKIHYANGTVEDGIVLDRGGDIVGDRADILVASREEAYAKGRQNVKIEIVK